MTAKRFKCHLGVVGVHIGVGTDEHELTGNECRDLLNKLSDENEQLQARNDRQAKQLDRLYNLIEQKDWRTLTDILDDFKRCEEQLQREWRTYK